MTITNAYQSLSSVLEPMYGAREGNIMARYLVEDLFSRQFYSEDQLSEDEVSRLDDALRRLKLYEPWQYVGGIADFYGLRFRVDPSVLIPRPETEELVYKALSDIHSHSLKSVLDIGTGSGIIGVTVKVKAPEVSVFAVDISTAALAVARKNAQALQTELEFVCADFLDESRWFLLPKVDLVVSNPPYIDATEMKDMDANVLDFEPHLALFTRTHPLEFYKAIATFVIAHQTSGCRILVEISEFRGEEVMEVFADLGLTEIHIFSDLQGKDRIVSAVRP